MTMLFIRQAEKTALTAAASFIEDMNKTMGVKIVMYMSYMVKSSDRRKFTWWVLIFQQKSNHLQFFQHGD
jgi:hypothetical protein